MNRLRVCYSDAYAPGDSPLFSRLAILADDLRQWPAIDLHAPRPIDDRALRGLHDDTYLDHFLAGEEPLASSQGIPWSPGVRDAVLAMLGGQLDAVAHALTTGIAMNLARGFHHAVRARGSGFCAINGLALVAHRLPEKRIFVIDCDEHGGNGTEEFTMQLPNLFAASIFGTRFGCHGSERSLAYPVDVRRDGFLPYHRALDDIEQRLVDIAPDVILYQAGVDCHQDDPKGRAGLSTQNLIERDRRVFELARRRQCPIVFVVAGGYQNPSTLARLNANTVRAALAVFGAAASASDPPPAAISSGRE